MPTQAALLRPNKPREREMEYNDKMITSRDAIGSSGQGFTRSRPGPSRLPFLGADTAPL